MAKQRGLYPLIWCGVDYFSLTKTVCRFHPAIRGDEHERCEYLWYRPREMTTDRAKRICSQIQKGRGIFADARPYYVVVSRRCHSTRYQFQLTTEGEHQKRILLDGNIRVLICRKFDSLSAASLYRLQLVEQYWNTYYNNFSVTSHVPVRSLKKN